MMNGQLFESTPQRLSSSAHRVVTLTLSGELGAVELQALHEELFRLAHRGIFKVVLDLARVHHLDYRGLKALAARVELSRKGGGDLKLAGLSSYLFAILRAAGAAGIFELYTTADAAVEAFLPASGRRAS